MKNLENKLQVLNENRGDVELREYVEMSAESDPNFFRWLFGEDFDNDFVPIGDELIFGKIFNNIGCNNLFNNVKSIRKQEDKNFFITNIRETFIN